MNRYIGIMYYYYFVYTFFKLFLKRNLLINNNLALKNMTLSIKGVFNLSFLKIFV